MKANRKGGDATHRASQLDMSSRNVSMYHLCHLGRSPASTSTDKTGIPRAPSGIHRQVSVRSFGSTSGTGGSGPSGQAFLSPAQLWKKQLSQQMLGLLPTACATETTIPELPAELDNQMEDGPVEMRLRDHHRTLACANLILTTNARRQYANELNEKEKRRADAAKALRKKTGMSGVDSRSALSRLSLQTLGSAVPGSGSRGFKSGSRVMSLSTLLGDDHTSDEEKKARRKRRKSRAGKTKAAVRAAVNTTTYPLSRAHDLLLKRRLRFFARARTDIEKFMWKVASKTLDYGTFVAVQLGGLSDK